MAGSTPASATAEVSDTGLVALEVVEGRGLARRLARTPSGAVGLCLMLLVLAAALSADALAPADPFAPVGPPLAPPSSAHPLGTDGLGRDLLSGILHGARTSLLVMGGVGALVLPIGMAVGIVAGYRGGMLDDLLMRGAEVLQVLPRFFLAIVVIALFGPGIDRLVLVLGFTSWPVLARVFRAEVLSLRERDFVQASIALGASDARILFRTILPHALPAGLVYLGLVLGQVILLEASLGFLGLGDPNTISWGYLAGQAQRFLRVAWWLSLFPGVAIIAAVLGLNLLADALVEVLSGRR